MWFLRRGHMWFLYRYFFSLVSFGISYLSLIFCSLKMRCVLSCFSHVWLFATTWTICFSPGSSVHRILQAKTLEWVAISYSRGSSQPRDGTHVSYVSCIGRWVLYHFPTWEALKMIGLDTIFLVMLNSGGRIVLLSKRFLILHLFVLPPPLKLLAATEFVSCYFFFSSIIATVLLFLKWHIVGIISMQPFPISFLPLEIEF